jgi:hypothetical protein
MIIPRNLRRTDAYDGAMNATVTIPRKSTQDNVIGLLFLAILVSFSAGCSSAYSRARVGNRPNTSLLESSLRLGESTRADVLAALGEPIGRGMARLPVDPRPNAGAMWSYYYEEDLVRDILSAQPSGESRRIFLFVFFDGDIYDGYMWFSSLLK